MERSRLGPEERRTTLRRMAEEPFDIAIVGGGVTGAGAALDAATRGLRVAMVEQRDWAAGTSSRSSKLIHGGLRYLEQLDFRLVREALREQSLMLERLCPHLVRPVPFLFPLRGRAWERVYVGAGIALYDLISGRRALPRHRHFSRKKTLERFPSLDPTGLRGAIQYYDAQVDDARHTLALARTAALHGAAAATSIRATHFVHSGSRVSGVGVRCLETGAELEIRADVVINASGVWTDDVAALAGSRTERVRASKGIHLVIPRDRIRGDAALIFRTPTSVLLVIPWGQHWIVGTTDTDWQLDLAHPAASRRDVDYLLESVNALLGQPLDHRDIEGVYAGLRPLLHGESDATSKLSREHAVFESAAGLVTVAGGKYTTYRVMAKDAVDLAVRSLPNAAGPCVTHEVPLIGAEGLASVRNRAGELARASSLSAAQIERLISRHGSQVEDVIGLCQSQPELATPLDAAPGYLAAEVHYAASHEGALHLDDVLTRRTRISIETFDRGLDSAERVADLMGPVLGWDDATRIREIQHYRARVDAERESQEQPDDRTADAARLGAPDVRMGGAEAPQTADVVSLAGRSSRPPRSSQ